MKHGEVIVRIAVWLSRIIVGATFIVSGWAKCVDPWGFVYKIGEYLTAMGLGDVVPADVVPVCAVGLSLVEMLTGVAVITGSFRRAAPIAVLAMMAVMLPLTVWIYVTNPVSDCGCFGDLFVLSDGMTLLKNIVITALGVLLLVCNRRSGCLLRPSLQWLGIALAGVYGLTISIIGWNIQPVVDFRPYPTGSVMGVAEAAESAPVYVYSKDGVESEFSLDALPDSTWTFVATRTAQGGEDGPLAVFDDDIEVTEEVLGQEALQGDVIILAVNNPSIDYLTRSRLANELNDAVETAGGHMVGLVAASGDAFTQWTELARPLFDVYSSGDTGLKQLARGNAAIVALRDGIVQWKLNLSALDPSVVNGGNPVDKVEPIDDGRVAWWLTGALAAALLLLFAYNAVSRPQRRSVNNSGN